MSVWARVRVSVRNWVRFLHLSNGSHWEYQGEGGSHTPVFFVVAQMGYDRCTNVAFVSCGKHHKHHLLRGTRAFTFFYFVKVGK